jgi:hypothetical protein
MSIGNARKTQDSISRIAQGSTIRTDAEISKRKWIPPGTERIALRSVFSL